MSKPLASKGVTADALLRRRLEEPTWVVPGLLPAGLAICAGKPKVGKSWLSLHLAIAIAAGRPFLGSTAAPGTVLYLALEDHLRRLQSRLTAVLQGDHAPRRLHLHVEWPALADGALDQLSDWLDHHPDAKLVIVDTLAKLRGPGPAAKGYRADYAEIAGLKNMADAHGVALLLVHHITKSRSDDPFEQFAGSVGLTAAADTLLHLSRQRGSDQCILRTTGRDIEEQELALGFHSGRFVTAGAADPEVALSPERRAILDFVRRSGTPVTPLTVSSGLGLPAGGTRKIRVLMRGQGVLVRVDGGYVPAPSHQATPATAPGNVLPFPTKARPAPPAS